MPESGGEHPEGREWGAGEGVTFPRRLPYLFSLIHSQPVQILTFTWRRTVVMSHSSGDPRPTNQAAGQLSPNPARSLFFFFFFLHQPSDRARLSRVCISDEAELRPPKYSRASGTSTVSWKTRPGEWLPEGLACVAIFRPITQIYKQGGLAFADDERRHRGRPWLFFFFSFFF